jgi:hypothetical protein
MSMPTLKIKIAVKPRHHKKVARLNLRKKRKVKVAILGDSNGFDVADIDLKSLTFGATGDEKTLRKCKRRFKDVNGDGVPDLVCKFSLRGSHFEADSSEAVLKGKTKSGKAFFGSDSVKIKAERKKVAHRSRRK